MTMYTEQQEKSVEPQKPSEQESWPANHEIYVRLEQRKSGELLSCENGDPLQYFGDPYSYESWELGPYI